MPKLLPETIARCAEWTREGKGQEWIAVTLGIDRQTYSRWLKRGSEEQPGSPYRQLYDAITAARKEARNGGRPSMRELAAERANPPRYTGELNPDAHEHIVRLLRQGNYLHIAALTCGLDPGIVASWIQRGVREGSGEHYEFAREANAALAECQSRIVDRAHQIAAQGENLNAALRAVEFILRQRHPTDWGEQQSRNAHQFVAAVLAVVREAADQHNVPAEFLESVYRGLSELSGTAAESTLPTNRRPVLPVAE